MRLKFQNLPWLFTVVLTLLSLTHSVSAQDDPVPKQPLQSAVMVKGVIGGESHNSYVIKAQEGDTMRVEISSRRKGNRHPDFTVSESPNFFQSEQVNFGKPSKNGKSWTGKVPKTQDYYIYVTGDGSYTLKVTTNKPAMKKPATK